MDFPRSLADSEGSTSRLHTLPELVEARALRINYGAQRSDHLEILRYGLFLALGSLHDRRHHMHQIQPKVETEKVERPHLHGQTASGRRQGLI